MFDRYTEIHPGMDVCDRDGEKIGTVHQVFPQSMTRAATAGAAALAPGLPSSTSVFQVDTGLLGLKHYYVPFSAINDIANDCIFVNAAKDDLGGTGWESRPDWLTG